MHLRMIGLVILATAAVAAVAACGVSNEHTVSGTVDQVSYTNNFFGQEKVEFQLAGDTNEYTCWIEDEAQCAFVTRGNVVALTMGIKESHHSYGETVLSLDFVLKN
jgi:hypothetical protein